MATQTYKNHRRLVPVYHVILYLVVLGCVGVAAWKAYNAFCVVKHERVIASLLLGLSIAALLLTWFTRSFALTAQDRAIRAEENLRHFALTGKLLDSRLKTNQIIALRFAEDTEFVILAERAANDKMKSEDIKKAIINWREDHYRV